MLAWLHEAPARGLPAHPVAWRRGRRDYGAFLDAQYAASHGRLDLAANGILAALQADLDNAELQRDAFGLTLLAGRPEAGKIAPSLTQNPVALLLLADRQARSGDWQGAELPMPNCRTIRCWIR